jgi:RNA polymerase sigma-70 factor (ECF subfamily)
MQRMAATKTRSETFLSAVAAPRREGFAALPALDGLLTQGLAAAHAAWPGIEVDEVRYFSYLAQRVPQGDDVEKALSSLAAADLYLACACAAGSQRAIAALEARYFREIDHALGRLHANASLIDDVKQRVRQQLFVGEAPGIANYSGSGQLRRWIRVIAVRALHRMRGSNRNEIAVEDHVIDALPDSAASPELLHLKQHYREAFRAAFAAAMTSLSSEERVLLRQHFVDGLNIDELAALHRVHRATAARWLAQAREKIAEQTRKLLMNQIKTPKADFDSILRLVQSQLDLSIRGHLREPKKKD